MRTAIADCVGIFFISFQEHSFLDAEIKYGILQVSKFVLNGV